MLAVILPDLTQILLIIPQYPSTDQEALKSVLFDLEIEKKSQQYQQREKVLSVFGPQRSGFGYSNWGTHDIGIEDPEDLMFYQKKQSLIVNNDLSLTYLLQRNTPHVQLFPMQYDAISESSQDFCRKLSPFGSIAKCGAYSSINTF